jgi:hypothetical protein
MADQLADVLEREGGKGKGFNEIVETHRLKLFDPFLIHFLSRFGRSQRVKK